MSEFHMFDMGTVNFSKAYGLSKQVFICVTVNFLDLFRNIGVFIVLKNRSRHPKLAFHSNFGPKICSYIVKEMFEE